jgi:hypothetical protein
MALLSLPPELLEMIILETMPEGFGSLTLSCKYLFRLCGPYIADYRRYLRREYTKFHFPSSHVQPEHNICTAFDLLVRIATEPAIASYIRKADFRWESDRIEKCERPDVKADVEDVHYGGKVARLMAESPYLQQAGLDWREYWAQIKKELTNTTLEVGYVNYSQHAAAFVLTLLPNVESVSLPAHWIKNDRTDRLLHAIYNKAAQADQTSGACSLSQCTRFWGQSRKMESLWFSSFEDLPHALSVYVPEICPWQPMPQR